MSIIDKVDLSCGDLYDAKHLEIRNNAGRYAVAVWKGPLDS